MIYLQNILLAKLKALKEIYHKILTLDIIRILYLFVFYIRYFYYLLLLIFSFKLYNYNDIVAKCCVTNALDLKIAFYLFMSH